MTSVGLAFSIWSASGYAGLCLALWRGDESIRTSVALLRAVGDRRTRALGVLWVFVVFPALWGLMLFGEEVWIALTGRGWGVADEDDCEDEDE